MYTFELHVEIKESDENKNKKISITQNLKSPIISTNWMKHFYDHGDKYFKKTINIEPDENIYKPDIF